MTNISNTTSKLYLITPGVCVWGGGGGGGGRECNVFCFDFFFIHVTVNTDQNDNRFTQNLIIILKFYYIIREGHSEYI